MQFECYSILLKHTIYLKRVPFTPGLIPKRRGEIADKIGQVVEEHLLTESVFKSKLNAPSSKEAIEALLLQQIAKLKQDSTTIQYFANKLDVNVTDYTNDKLQQLVHTNLDKFYLEHKDQPVNMILPEEIEQAIDEKVALLPDLLFSRRVFIYNLIKVQQILHRCWIHFSKKRENRRVITNVYDEGKYR